MSFISFLSSDIFLDTVKNQMFPYAEAVEVHKLNTQVQVDASTALSCLLKF